MAHHNGGSLRPRMAPAVGTAATRSATSGSFCRAYGNATGRSGRENGPTTGRIGREDVRTRAGVEPPGHFQLDDAASSADSEGSWRDTSSEDLERMLKTPFRPGVEALQGFERRLSRSRAVLALRGIPTNHAEIQRLIHVARLAERYRVNGGIDALNRDMEEELDCDGDDIRLDELLAAAGLLGNGVRRAVRPTSMLQPAAAPAAAAASDQPKRNLVTQFEDVMSEASEKAELIPADLVRTLLSHLDKNSSKKSTIQIRPDVTWPSLSDLDQDIETFFEELDDICDLANDADGMSDIGRLRVLGNCLKQSRKKVYRVKLKEARASGLLKTDPGKVFEEIRVRLMEFRESALEKQNRVENEYQNLTKGNLSALQFLPQFESLTSEMDICGVGLSERQLLLGYLRKVWGGSQERHPEGRTLIFRSDRGTRDDASRSYLERSSSHLTGV